MTAELFNPTDKKGEKGRLSPGFKVMLGLCIPSICHSPLHTSLVEGGGQSGLLTPASGPCYQLETGHQATAPEREGNWVVYGGGGD